MAEKQTPKEKIVNLCEDSNTHKHDQAGFERLMRAQEQAKHNKKPSGETSKE